MASTNEIEHISFVDHRVRAGETLASIAEEHGITWRELALFNFHTAVPREVNRYLHEYVGCTRRTKDGKNYVFSDHDVPGIIHIPEHAEPLVLATGKQHRIRVKRPVLYSRVEVQTVNEFGHRMGNVDLTLRSLDGLPDVLLHSGASGYGKLDKVRAGRYRVLLAGGEPTYIGTATQPGRGDGKKADAAQLSEAVIDTRHHSRTITRVVIARTASQEQRAQRQLEKKIYERTGTTTLGGRGEETSGNSRRSNRLSIDNLALAAGWTSDYKDLNVKKLAASVLRGFLRDYHPTALARGYHILVLTPATRILVLVNSEGATEKRFELLDRVATQGLVGAYAMFENVSGAMFVDMTTMSATVGVPGNEDGLSIEEIVSDPDAFVEALDKHAGEVQIIYYAPTGQQLAALGLEGGTGRLEDYGSDDEVNRSVHQRNLAVCSNIKVAYDGYVNSYIAKVEKTHNEGELRRLGPPQSPFELPTPAGATTTQMIEIFNALNTSEFKAWLAIAHHLDRFANRLSQGYPFLRIKPKFVARPKTINKIKNYLRPGLPDISETIPIEVEFELNIDIQVVDGQFEVITRGDAIITGKAKLDSVVKRITKSGIPVEITYKQSLGNPEKRTVSVKVSKFQIEVDTVGKSKLSLQVQPGLWVDSEMNSSAGIFGGGITLKGKELAPRMRGKTAFLDKWADRIENFEVQVQIGLVGTREETILAVVSSAPGFFQQRSLTELFDPGTQWVDLALDEQHSLVALGWYAAVWDGKYHVEYKDKLPASVNESRLDLSATEKVAIVHLGFYAYEDYKKLFKKSVGQFNDYVY